MPKKKLNTVESLSQNIQDYREKSVESAENFEKSITKLGTLANYGWANRYLLAASELPGKDFVSKEDLKTVGIDGRKLNGFKFAEVYVPKKVEEKKVSEWEVGKVYSTDELKEKFPEEIKQLNIKKSAMNFLTYPQKKRAFARAAQRSKLNNTRELVENGDNLQALKNEVALYVVAKGGNLTRKDFQLGDLRETFESLSNDDRKKLLNDSLKKGSYMMRNYRYQARNEVRNRSKNQKQTNEPSKKKGKTR